MCPNLVMLTVGTGVGGGLVFNGRLYRGVTSAGELGHTVIGLDLEDGAPVPEGKHPLPGTLEYLAAGRALDRLAEREAQQEEDSFLGKRLAQDGEVTGHDVVDGAKAGDADALRVLDILGQRLGIGIANAINLFDPQEIVIGGGVSIAGDLLLEPARSGRGALHGARARAGTRPSGSRATAPRPASSARRWSPRRRRRSSVGMARRPASSRRTISRSPSTASSATSTRSRWSGRTGRSTGTAARPSTRRACSASILDADKGGFYALRPTADEWTSKQLYFPDTNVLITRFFTEDGVGEVQDFMPIDHAEMAHAPPPAAPPRRRRARRRWASRSRCSRASTTGAPSTRSRCTRTACCSARRT